VEIRNERGEAFEGRIVPLPASFDEEFRAAWGVATSCRQDCTLSGFDDTGRLLDGAMLRPSGRDLTAEERLELIRGQCDSSMKDHTWALKRMPSIPEQAEHVREVENSRRAVAMWLAYVEGADDPRSALSAVDAIIQRYEAAPDWQEWDRGSAASAANVPWRRGSKVRPSRRLSVARPTSEQTRRGWRGRLALPRGGGRPRRPRPTGCDTRGKVLEREGRDDVPRNAERGLLEQARSGVKQPPAPPRRWNCWRDDAFGVSPVPPVAASDLGHGAWWPRRHNMSPMRRVLGWWGERRWRQIGELGGKRRPGSTAQACEPTRRPSQSRFLATHR